jgi:hypothetical protein
MGPTAVAAVARATGRRVHGHLLTVDDHAERAVDHLAVRVEPERQPNTSEPSAVAPLKK